MKLYIIGNGFDLYHHLPSTYYDFRDFVKEKDPFVFGMKNILIIPEHSGMLLKKI